MVWMSDMTVLRFLMETPLLSCTGNTTQVAVAGLPDPRKDHAVVMARFARECMTSLQFLTKRLEVSLGPDTADLSMRIGLHSGPGTSIFSR